MINLIIDRYHKFLFKHMLFLSTFIVYHVNCNQASKQTFEKGGAKLHGRVYTNVGANLKKNLILKPKLGV